MMFYFFTLTRAIDVKEISRHPYLFIQKSFYIFSTKLFLKLSGNWTLYWGSPGVLNFLIVGTQWILISCWTCINLMSLHCQLVLHFLVFIRNETPEMFSSFVVNFSCQFLITSSWKYVLIACLFNIKFSHCHLYKLHRLSASYRDKLLEYPDSVTWDLIDVRNFWHVQFYWASIHIFSLVLPHFNGLLRVPWCHFLSWDDAAWHTILSQCSTLFVFPLFVWNKIVVTEDNRDDSVCKGRFCPLSTFCNFVPCYACMCMLPCSFLFLLRFLSI